jgi:hypothetical protein
VETAQAFLRVRPASHIPLFFTNLAQNINQAIRSIGGRPQPEQRILANALAALTKEYQNRLAANDTPIPPPQFKGPDQAAAASGDAGDDDDEEDGNEEDDALDNDYRPGTSRKARLTTTTTTTTSTSTTIIRFTKIHYPVSSAHGIPDMLTARSAFYRAVKDARGDNNTPLFPDTPKGRAELLDMVNYIFTDVLGGARPRLIAIIKEHQGAQNNELAAGVAALAENHSRDQDLPRPIREYFSRFALVKRSEAKNNSPYGGLWRHLRFIQFLNAHHLVLTAMQDPEGEIVQELAAKGYQTAQGRSRSSVVQQYFMEMLQISEDAQKKQFSNYLNNARAINALIETFQPGILALLPANAYYK